jgi:hypothetical protein
LIGINRINGVMRAKTVNEIQNFERGRNPKSALNLGVVAKIMDYTRDAYSYDRYGEDVWEEIIEFLLSKNVLPEVIEWVLISKHMRWAADSIGGSDQLSLKGFKQYYEIDRNALQQNIEQESGFINEEAMGGVSAPISTLNNTPGMGNAQPAAKASTGSFDGASTGSGDNWDSSTGKIHVQENLKENNISPYDKLGVAMAQKMGIPLAFKKGKGDKDVEQVEVDVDVDLSTKLVTFEEWAKKFLGES